MCPSAFFLFPFSLRRRLTHRYKLYLCSSTWVCIPRNSMERRKGVLGGSFMDIHLKWETAGIGIQFFLKFWIQNYKPEQSFQECLKTLSLGNGSVGVGVFILCNEFCFICQPPITLVSVTFAKSAFAFFLKILGSLSDSVLADVC